jgi:serine/threonine-protein kinase
MGTNDRIVRDPLIGRTIGGRYRLIQRLGTGGMSSVYLARHVLIDRLMAIKTLRRDLAQDPTQRDRFIREARAVNRINHANIVEITDFGESEDGLVYLVMEYIAGESLLKAMTTSGPFPTMRAIDIAEQAGSALARAHQMGVIHRDLKPENMILVTLRDRKDFLKILDFGIAKITDAPSLTGSQQIFGTPGYIAPEYIQSTAIDGRADLYSLGVILYELVTGALPFDYEYPGDLLVKHVTEKPFKPSARRADVPGPMEAFILRCLQKNPDERFRDAFHFLDELRATRELLGPELSWAGLNEPVIPIETAAAIEDGVPVPISPAGGVGRDDRTPPEQFTPKHHTPATLGPGALGHATDRTPTTEQKIEVPDEARRHDTTIPPPIGGPAEYASDGSSRPVTAEYHRPAIPVAPNEDLEIEVEVAEPEGPEDTRAAHVSTGLAGAKRWRERFEAIRGLVEELAGDVMPKGEIVRDMALAERSLESLEESVKTARMHQQAVESLSERARDFRATLGKTIDELAAELSKRRGDLSFLAQRRDDLAERRDAARRGVKLGGVSEGQADALLWELAAVEEELRQKSGQCDEVEAQLGELRARLERENEELEIELTVNTHVLDQEMARLWPLATALRDPLARVEDWVRTRWVESPVEAE